MEPTIDPTDLDLANASMRAMADDQIQAEIRRCLYQLGLVSYEYMLSI